MPEGLLAKEGLTKLFPVFPSPSRVSSASTNNSHILKIGAIATRAKIKLYFVLQHRRITEPVKSVANLIDSLHHEIPGDTGMRIKNERKMRKLLCGAVGVYIKQTWPNI